MWNYEYKAVPLPPIGNERLKRGVTRSDQVAAIFEQILNREAAAGWDYVRSESVNAPPAPRMFARQIETEIVTVLIFRKMIDAVRNAPPHLTPEL